jgi:hypothetical protein
MDDGKRNAFAARFRKYMAREDRNSVLKFNNPIIFVTALERSKVIPIGYVRLHQRFAPSMYLGLGLVLVLE